jgi:hypothetical protein
MTNAIHHLRKNDELHSSLFLLRTYCKARIFRSSIGNLLQCNNLDRLAFTFRTAMNTPIVRLMILGSLIIAAVCSLVYAFVAHQGNDNTQRILASSINASQAGQKNMNNTPNPVAYFEIPVLDMERAVWFPKYLMQILRTKKLMVTKWLYSHSTR